MTVLVELRSSLRQAAVEVQALRDFQDTQGSPGAAAQAEARRVFPAFLGHQVIPDFLEQE